MKPSSLVSFALFVDDDDDVGDLPPVLESRDANDGMDVASP